MMIQFIPVDQPMSESDVASLVSQGFQYCGRQLIRREKPAIAVPGKPGTEPVAEANVWVQGEPMMPQFVVASLLGTAVEKGLDKDTLNTLSLKLFNVSIEALGDMLKQTNDEAQSQEG
jgi:hypothetical protein